MRMSTYLSILIVSVIHRNSYEETGEKEEEKSNLLFFEKIGNFLLLECDCGDIS